MKHLITPELIISLFSTCSLVNLFSTQSLILREDKQCLGSYIHRLESEKLKEWLNDYSLDDLWLPGELGGTQ